MRSIKIRQRFQEKSITTHELLQVFEEELPPSLWYEGKQSLEWFDEGWVNGTALPHFELHGVKYTQKTSGSVVSGAIMQDNAPEGSCDSRPGLRCRSGKTVLLGQVFADRTGNQFSFASLPQAHEGRARFLPDLTDTTANRLQGFRNCVPGSRNGSNPDHSKLRSLSSEPISSLIKAFVVSHSRVEDGLQSA